RGDAASHVLITLPHDRRFSAGGLALKPFAAFAVIVVTLSINAAPASAQAAPKPDRQVALTIDDLPAGMSDEMPAAAITEMTAKLLGTLPVPNIRAVAF